MDLDLQGRVAMVTGGSQGIGRSIALALAAEGADIVLVARRREPLESVAKEIEAIGTAAHVIDADVATTDGTATAFAGAVERFARVDILVNNAGKGSPKPMLELGDEDWLASIQLNLMSAVRLSLACVPLMKEQQWGRLIHISSRVAREPDPYFAPYSAAKAAVINFSKNLANGFSQYGVLSNCIVPGLIHSEAIDQAAEQSAAATGKTVDEVFAATLAKRPIPAGRLGEPTDVASLVALLASDHASWITGACFTVDGGIVRGDR